LGVIRGKEATGGGQSASTLAHPILVDVFGEILL